MNISAPTDLITLPAIQALVDRNWSQETELMVLAAALNLPHGFALTVGHCDAGDFFDPIHAALFTEIADRRTQGRAVDAALLRELAERMEAEGQAGVRDLLRHLTGTLVLAANVTGYAEDLRNLARRRRLMEVTLTACQRADRAENIDDLVSATIAEVEGLVGGGKARHRFEVLRQVVSGLERPGAIFSTGLPSLDRVMGGGLEVGRFYAIAGRGKAGKSLLAGTISHHLNRRGVKHAYAALEMGAAEIETRKIAHDLGTNSLALRGQVGAALLGKVGTYAAEAPDHMIYIDMPGGTMQQLRAEVMAARHKHRCTGIIIDYWQLVGGRDRAVSEEEHLRIVAQWLAAAAKRLGIWVLVLAQLADDGEAPAVCRTGLNRNADQLFFIRGEADSPDRWLEMKLSRFTPVADIGGPDAPAFRIEGPGPFFRDLAA
ncbi:DnaB-like helicase C-terminal domain-containing protein [Niveispirillum sp.]|uniref:DnaB-like helicase C-terminal domain-containing protein n=1 Tax=Niveispirillum sp. TaxID=1917217 RepID=UPI001B594167|nr:DnaB-like helicase C-terminal domain-containing protein [Niveispirillum sp.]MBP7334940.1 hypothetical protein [Niveispirillum sp.]